jgi:hypothetical protein
MQETGKEEEDVMGTSREWEGQRIEDGNMQWNTRETR